MGIGLPVFTFVVSVVGLCTGAVWGVRHAVHWFLGCQPETRAQIRTRRLWLVRLGLVLAGALVLLAGFVALPILFRRGASPSLARIVPLLQTVAFFCLIAVSIFSENVFRRHDGEARALWRLAGRMALLEGAGLFTALAGAAVILFFPRWALIHFGQLRWWEPYFLIPLTALAVLIGICLRAAIRPLAIRLIFHARPLTEGDPAAAIGAVHERFGFPAPKVLCLPSDGSGRVTANRRGLFGRHAGWRRDTTFVTEELCRDLTLPELDALARREVAHGILRTSRHRLGRLIALSEAMLLAAWLYPKLQVPLVVTFGFDARLVRLWLPLLALGISLWAAVRAWNRDADDDEHRADLYAVEVLGAPLSELSHGLRKVFAGTIAESDALDRRLAALDNGLRTPSPVRLLSPEERETILLHRRRVGFGLAGGFALVLVAIGFSPYGQRSILQWRVALAIRSHDKAAVGKLLARGASPNREDLFGMSPVSAAAGSGDLDLLRTLISHGGAVQNESWPKQPLHEAAAKGRLDAIAFLLENGAQVNATDFYGRTPLMVAVANGRRDTVKFLLQHGARLGSRDTAGHTALQLAEGNGDRDIARLLRKVAR